MEKNTFIKFNLIILLFLACSLSNISASDTIGSFGETTLTVINPNDGATYTSPTVTVKLQKIVDYDLITDIDYILPIQYCYVNYQLMDFSNSTMEIGEYIANVSSINGQKTITIDCYSSPLNIENILENLTYNKTISFNIDFTSLDSCADLDLMNLDLNANYELSNNIDCVAGGPTIGSYYGVFDGNGYNISNYASSSALFSNLYGQIKNVQMQNVSVNGGQWSSGLVTVAQSGSIIDNVKIYGKIVGDTSSVGGIVGESWGTIKNSETNAEIDGSYGQRVGGIVGYNNQGIIDKCISRSKIIKASKVGGIAGYNIGLINNSEVYGEINAMGGSQVGGITGYNNGKIEKSKTDVTIEGNTDIGGLVGQNGAGDTAAPILSSSYSVGNITTTGTNTNIGGAIGKNYAKIKDVYYIKTDKSAATCIGNNTAKDTNSKDCGTQSTAAALNITINGTTNFTGYTGYFDFLILDDKLKPVMEFNYSIVNGSLTFNDTIVMSGTATKASGYLIINGMNTSLMGGTKTIYLDRKNITMTDVCIKDQEINSSDEISAKCDQKNEYIVKCDGKNYFGYTCSLTNDDTQYKITGLKHSGVIQTDAVAETPTTSTSSGGSSHTSTVTANSSNSTVVTSVLDLTPTLYDDGEINIEDMRNEIKSTDAYKKDNAKEYVFLTIAGLSGLGLLYIFFDFIINRENRKMKIRDNPKLKLKTKY